MDTKQDSKTLLQAAMEKQRAIQAAHEAKEGIPFVPEPAPVPISAVVKAVVKPPVRVDTRTGEQKQADRQKYEAEQARREQECERQKNQKRWKDLLKEMGPRHVQKKLKDRVAYGTPEEQARQDAVFNHVSEFGRNLKANIQTGRNLVLYGSRGTGKDFCVSNLLGMAVAYHGFQAGWQSGMRMYRAVRDSMRKDSRTSEQEIIDDLSRHPLLVISDPLPPVGNLTPFQAETLLTILDERYRFNRPTWITINVSDRAEFEARMGSLAVDRLLEDATALYFDWPSFRQFGTKSEQEAAA